MANQILARLGIVMAVDSAELEVGLSKAKEQFKGFTKEVQRQSNEAAKETLALKMAAPGTNRIGIRKAVRWIRTRWIGPSRSSRGTM